MLDERGYRPPSRIYWPILRKRAPGYLLSLPLSYVFLTEGRGGSIPGGVNLCGGTSGG